MDRHKRPALHSKLSYNGRDLFLDVKGGPKEASTKQLPNRSRQRGDSYGFRNGAASYEQGQAQALRTREYDRACGGFKIAGGVRTRIHVYRSDFLDNNVAGHLWTGNLCELSADKTAENILLEERKIMSYVVDYHIHSCYSDGTMTPVELVRKYKDAEYDIISITDHDGIGGLKEASIAAETLKIKFIPGVEISTEHHFEGEGEEGPELIKIGIHMLGYDFDPEDEVLRETLDKFREYRKQRNQKLGQKLKEMGYDIDMAQLESRSAGGYVGKPNIARELARKGYIRDFADAFEPGRLLESPEIKSIHKDKISPSS